MPSDNEFGELDAVCVGLTKSVFLILSFRHVLYVMRFLLGISPASEC